MPNAPTKSTTVLLPELLTVPEVAGYLGVCTHTVRLWIKGSKLPAGKVGGSWRVQAEHVLELVTPKDAA